MIINSSDIVSRLKNSEESVFEMVFSSYFPRLVYFTKEYLPDEETARNIVHDTFLSLWNERAKLQDNTNLNAWLFTVARNKSLKYLRHLQVEKKFKEYSLIQQQEIQANQIALSHTDTSELTFQEIQQKIEQTMAQLPEQCRKIFQLSRFEDKKNKEIAEELEISIKTVEAQITKALKLFRINLQEYLPIIFF
ncbi:RNA polymerase sigma-70 factor [Puteibacter caeruleilacunae]|nr:RNA polymerase sigma-70 factor [Puteibacter caeruleilacunae]